MRECACKWDGQYVVALCGAHEEAFREREAELTKRFTKAGWRACIDHIIKPESDCPVCENEKLRERIAKFIDEENT
jgi:spore coat polysaccharide biosynthesis protein SpsF (cytidylyltransferase family)